MNTLRVFLRNCQIEHDACIDKIKSQIAKGIIEDKVKSQIAKGIIEEYTSPFASQSATFIRGKATGAIFFALPLSLGRTNLARWIRDGMQGEIPEIPLETEVPLKDVKSEASYEPRLPVSYEQDDDELALYSTD